MKISVCMIVRDEVKTLPRCLNSIRELCDELCLVDTGSRDGTLDLARELGAKVQSYTACNDDSGRIEDFASARNRVLRMATGDWILQIDADEVMVEGADGVRSYCKNTKFDHIGIRVSSEGATWFSGRLFRRNPNLRYRSRIHEYLEGAGRFKICDRIAIENMPDKGGKESAHDRNIRICKLALSETPDEGRLHFYLANEYRRAGDLTAAAQSYRRALNLGNFKVGLYHTVYYLGTTLVLLGKLNDAADAALTALKIDPRYAESYCLLGDVSSVTGRHDHAQHWYRLALKCRPPRDALLGVQSWAYDEYPRARLASLKAAKGGAQYEAAKI